MSTLPELKSGSLNDAIVFVDGMISVTVKVVEICKKQSDKRIGNK